MTNSGGNPLHSTSIGVDIFFSLIFSYFCFLVAALSQGLTLVPISAELELFCPSCNPTNLTHECVLGVAQVESNMNVCKPLP